MSRAICLGLIALLVQVLPAVSAQTCGQYSSSYSVCMGSSTGSNGRKPSWLQCTWLSSRRLCTDNCLAMALSNCTSSRKCKQSSTTYWDSSASEFKTGTKCFFDCESFTGSSSCPTYCGYHSYNRKCYTSCTSFSGKNSYGCPSTDCLRYAAPDAATMNYGVYCAPGQCATTTSSSYCSRYSGCEYSFGKCRIRCNSLGTTYYDACVGIPNCKQMTEDSQGYTCGDGEGSIGLAGRSVELQRSTCSYKHVVRKTCERKCSTYISSYDCHRYRYHMCGWNPITELCEERCDVRDPTTCTRDSQCIKLPGKDEYGHEKCVPNCVRATDSSTCDRMSCQWLSGSQTCGQNCNYYKYNYSEFNSWDFNVSCSMQPECEQDDTWCGFRCAGYGTQAQCTNRWECKWDLTKSANELATCSKSCNSFSKAEKCTKAGTGCEWENINRCSHTCKATDASAPCYLNRYNEWDCQRSNNICQRRCSTLNIKSCNETYAPHCQRSKSGSGCEPKCGGLSRADCNVETDHCTWTGSVCSPQCMNLTDAASCQATGICKWYAGNDESGDKGLCFTDCSKFTTQGSCARAAGCAFNTFEPSGYKCQPVGDCYKLSTDYINHENRQACAALPWCTYSTSYQRCRSKCSALTTQAQCGEVLWCEWNTTIPASSGEGEGKAIIAEEMLADHAMKTQRTAPACEPRCFAFDRGSQGNADSKPLHCNYYRNFAEGQTECKYLHTEAICTGGFNDCIWTNGKCQKPCMARSTENECKDWDQCEYYNPVIATSSPNSGGGEERMILTGRSLEAQQAAAASSAIGDSYRRSKKCYPKQTCATQTTEAGCLSISPYKCFWSEGKCVNTCQNSGGDSCKWFDNQGDQCVNMSTTYLSYMTIGYFGECMPKCDNYGPATCAKLGIYGCTMRNGGCKLACNYFWGKCPPGCAVDADGICAEAANPKKMVRSKMKMAGKFTQAMLTGNMRIRLIRALRTDLSTYLGVHYDAVLIISLRLGSLEVDFEVMDVNNDAAGIVGKVNQLPAAPIDSFSETKKVYADEGGDVAQFTGVTSASAEEVEIDDGSGLSAGAIAGIVIGCVVVVGIIGGAAFFALGGKKNGGGGSRAVPSDEKAQPMLPMSSSAPQPASASHGAQLQSQPIGQPQGTLAPLGQAQPHGYAPPAPARAALKNDLDDDADML